MKIFSSKKQLLATAIGIMVLGLSACSSTDVALQSKVQLPDAYSQQQIAHANQMDLSRWWQSWQDPTLSMLIEKGIANNFELQAARYRYEAAEHIATLAKRDLLPMVGAGGNIGYNNVKIDNPLDARTSAIIGSVVQNNLGNQFDVEGKHYAYGVSASWEPDIFGGKRSDADAAQAVALGSKELIYGAQMLLGSAIADNYLSYRYSEARLKVLDQSIATLTQLKRYVEGRFRAGQATRYEVDDVATQLAALQAKREPLLAVMVAHEKQVAVLIGETPMAFKMPTGSVKVSNLLAPIPNGQIPSELLLKRPDLRAHGRTVEALTAQLASAKADLLPRFYMNFSWLDGKIGIGGGNDLSGYGSIASFGVNLPIFTAGRIKANISASNARLNAAVASLDNALLKALSEVEIAYSAQYQFNQSAKKWQNAYQMAGQQANHAQKLYQHGEKLLSDVLTARLNALAYEDQWLQTQLMSQQAAIGLYQALGGGWQAENE